MTGLMFSKSSINGLENLKEIYLVKDEDHNIVCAVDSIDKYDELMEGISWWSDSDELLTDKTVLVDSEEIDPSYWGDEYTVLVDRDSRISKIIYEKTRGFSITKGVDLSNIYKVIDVYDYTDEMLAIHIIVPQFVDTYPDREDIVAKTVANDYINTFIDNESRKGKYNIDSYNNDLLNDILED